MERCTIYSDAERVDALRCISYNSDLAKKKGNLFAKRKSFPNVDFSNKSGGSNKMARPRSENNKIKKTTTQWPESFSELNRGNKSTNYAGKKGRYHLPASKS